MSDKEAIRVAYSNIMTAFEEKTIGTKVVDKPNFLTVLRMSIQLHDWKNERVQGQANIMLDNAAKRFVSCGVGARSMNPDDYVLRFYRERVSAFLKREQAVKDIHTLSAIVYTVAGYLDDPDVKDDQPEKDRIVAQDPTHVLVAVLATPCAEGYVTPFRYVANLAGGNKSYLPGNVTVGELNDLAKRVIDYDKKWVTVAD